jgi:hypothetical protein
VADPYRNNRRRLQVVPRDRNDTQDSYLPTYIVPTSLCAKAVAERYVPTTAHCIYYTYSA